MSYVLKKPKKQWQPGEREQLAAEYPYTMNSDLAKKYGINRQSVENMAKREGWRKSKEFLRQQSIKGANSKHQKDGGIAKMVAGMKKKRIATGLLYQKKGVMIHIGD